jgi:hypothetical protein
MNQFSDLQQLLRVEVPAGLLKMTLVLNAADMFIRMLSFTHRWQVCILLLLNQFSI